MNVLNKYFNKVYVISSYATHSRLSELLLFLDTENIQYELIIAPKKKYFKPDYDKTLVNEGAQSLISANESIFLKESYLKSDSFFIFEDDVNFDVNYVEKFNFFISQIPKKWDIINFGYHAHNNHLHAKFSEFDKYYNLKRACCLRENENVDTYGENENFFIELPDFKSVNEKIKRLSFLSA